LSLLDRRLGGIRLLAVRGCGNKAKKKKEEVNAAVKSSHAFGSSRGWNELD
jgi:hypothetical protein